MIIELAYLEVPAIHLRRQQKWLTLRTPALVCNVTSDNARSTIFTLIW